MSRPLVTVVIPAFDSERFLAESIQSALAQAYEPIETIVVDDGSTDGTAAVAAAFGEKVRLIRQENSGPSAARNSAVAACTGELIAFQDADDVMTPDRIEVQVSYLLSHPEVGCVLGHADHFFEPGAERPYWARGTKNPLVAPSQMAKPGWGSPEADSQPGHPEHKPHTMSALVRREVLAAVGGFDETMRHGEDVDLLLRLVDAGFATSVLSDVIVHRRIHDANLTHDAAAGREAMFRVVKARIERKRRIG